jgi:archaemetzincin
MQGSGEAQRPTSSGDAHQTATEAPPPRHVIDLVPIFIGDERSLLEPLAGWLEGAFGLPVRTRAPWFDPESVFDPNRSQYNSTLFLAELLNDPHVTAPKILGVTSVDLFIPVLTYVFGEAQLDGRAAIVSTHRLRSEAYGLPPDQHELLARLIKEATHELGHTYGLIHCRDATCVMRASTYVEDIDLKSARFCPDCWAAMAPRLAI